jgi:hypothetical protein
VNKIDCNSSANKSNHPIQNPLLLVTKPRTRDSTLTTWCHIPEAGTLEASYLWVSFGTICDHVVDGRYTPGGSISLSCVTVMVIIHTPSWRSLPTHVILCRHEDDGFPSIELSRGTKLPSSLFSSSQSLGTAVSTATERWTRAVQHCGPQHCRIRNIKQMRTSERSSSTCNPLFHGEGSRVGIVTRSRTERPRNRCSIPSRDKRRLSTAHR